MAIKQTQQEEQMPKQAQQMGQEALGPAVLAAAASVGLSWYYFFVRGDRQRGLFVGLWPPTILAFASYFNQRRMQRQIRMLTQPGTTLRNAIDSVMGNK
ncbi:hypothetical protein [Natrononativus amylolyticus]|uniref:hypothetical protein n=1 Tax=Natrononativus amylolyticus TaxID=2963434 RepID=UPI0020CC45E5|nr:hypothetical protein [Natrononativus amylolyticus]